MTSDTAAIVGNKHSNGESAALGKTVEDYRTPRRFAFAGTAAKSARSWNTPVLWRFGTGRDLDSWLLLLRRFGGLLELGQFLFPLGSLDGLAPGVVELHEPFEGFRDPARGVENRGQAGLALLESLIALEQGGSASA